MAFTKSILPCTAPPESEGAIPGIVVYLPLQLIYSFLLIFSSFNPAMAVSNFIVEPGGRG